MFSDVKGRIDIYIQMRAQAAGKTVEPARIGTIIGAIRTRLFRNESEDPTAIRTSVDGIMLEMGY